MRGNSNAVEYTMYQHANLASFLNRVGPLLISIISFLGHGH